MNKKVLLSMVIVGSFTIVDNSMATPKWLNDIGNWFKGAEKKVEKVVGNVVHEVEHVGEQVLKTGGRLAGQVVNTVGRVAETGANIVAQHPEIISALAK
ncbi:MAG: hypothetical protein LBL30_03100 [Holosporales bacterium]|jgi:hypothetical protein|nr:hypothetical protein [Holosporales bacterium]